MENTEVTDELLEEWETQDSETTIPDNEDINLESIRVIKSNQDYNLDYLISSINKNIDLGPEYQRRSRWTKQQKSRLIESFLMNIPVPPIFLYEKDYYQYEVIDGKQRLEAINAFFKDEFKLSDLEYIKGFEDKKFRDLEDEIKRLLFRRTITATILLVESKSFDKYDLRMILFNRLNTGGVKLNGQELRNAIYDSPFNNLIMELSTNSFFRKLWNIPNPLEGEHQHREEKKLRNNPLYKNMMDCELVLRFFAVREVYEDKVLAGSMKILLDETMKKNKSLNEPALENKRELFISSVEGLIENIGEQAIINPKLANPRKARNLYDSMLVAYSYIDINNLQDRNVVINNINATLNDENEYELIISKGNSIENIKYRVDKAKEILTLNLS